MALKAVPRTDFHKYGMVKSSSHSSRSFFPITDIIEKPSPGKSPSNFGAIGRYLLHPEIFDILKDQEAGHGGEIQLTDAIKTMIGQQPVYACLIQGKRFDLGSKEEYFQACLHEAKKRGYII